MSVRISSAEKDYIVAGCDAGVRGDGRGPDDYRSITVENNIFPHVDGSARVKVAESIDILCSVKLEVAEPSSRRPEEGLLEVSADISPSFKVSSEQIQSICAHVSERLQSTLLDSSAINMKKLCIIPGKFCWSIKVDLMILQLDGSPLEACSIAAYVALQCTRIPHSELTVGESGNYEDFDISGDLSQSTPLDCSSVPVCISIVKIGSALIVDATSEEQECANCAVSIALDKEGSSCCGMSFVQSGVLLPSDISRCFMKAQSAASAIHEQLASFFISQSDSSTMNEALTSQPSYPDLPPERMGLLV